MTFKDLVQKISCLQALLLDNEYSPELVLTIVKELSELRTYLAQPDFFIDDIKELIQTC